MSSTFASALRWISPQWVLGEARNESNRTMRQQMYEALEKWVHEEFRPMVPLLSAQQSVAWRTEVEGIYVDSTGTYRLLKAKFKK